MAVCASNPRLPSTWLRSDCSHYIPPACTHVELHPHNVSAITYANSSPVSAHTFRSHIAKCLHALLQLKALDKKANKVEKVKNKKDGAHHTSRQITGAKPCSGPDPDQRRCLSLAQWKASCLS